MGTIIIFVVFIDLFSVSYSSFFTKAFIIKDTGIKVSEKFYSLTIFSVDYKYDNKMKIAKNFYYDNNYLPWGTEYTATKNNIGTINCYEPIPIKEYAIGKDNENYKGEIYLIDNKSKVDILYWSPNKVIVNLLSKGTLVMNQNYDSHWLIKVNGKIKNSKDYNGLVSYSIDKPQEVTFFYNPFYVN